MPIWPFQVSGPAQGEVPPFVPQPSSTRQVSSTGLSRRCCLRASPDRPTRLRLAVPKWTRRQGEETPLGPSSGEETPISQDGMSYRVRSLPSSLFHPSNRALPSDSVARVEKLCRTPPPPPPKRRKSDPDASRPSEPAPASQVAQVEETSPAPVQAPQVLVPEPQAAQPDTTQPMAGAGGDAPVPPSPAPVEGPTLEPAQASNLDSSSIQAAQSKAPEEAPPGTTAGTVETAQAEESSPAAKVPTEEVPLPSAQVEEASPTKAEPPSFLPFEFPDSSAPSLPHSEASPAQAKSATGEAEAPAHTSARSLLSSSTDDSDTLEPVASPQDEESSPELKRELPEISSAQDPEDLTRSSWPLRKSSVGRSSITRAQPIVLGRATCLAALLMRKAGSGMSLELEGTGLPSPLQHP